jgi:hypothetical protein
MVYIVRNLTYESCREESVDAVRLQNCFRELRKRASDKKNEKGTHPVI